MLRRAPGEIGEVLRHRGPNTTEIYDEVDGPVFPTSLDMQWPERG